MPRPMKWGCKFIPDPLDKRYTKIIGKYDDDFLEWMKHLGKPCWVPGGIQGVISRSYWLRDPEIVLSSVIETQAQELEVLDKGKKFRIFWPLHVLEPVYAVAMSRGYSGLISSQTGMEMPCKW